MQWTKRLGLMAIVLLFSCVTFAQEVAPAAENAVLNWGPIAAGGIGVLVMLLVQLVRVFVPGLDGGVKQVIALVAGPGLTWLASVVSTAFGYPVNFQSLIDALAAATGSSLTAMGVFDVLKSIGVVGKK